MKRTKTKEECWVQAEAFRRLPGDELELIRSYAAGFRQIILEFENTYGRVPTADDLIWIESQHQGRDITQTA